TKLVHYRLYLVAGDQQRAGQAARSLKTRLPVVEAFARLNALAEGLGVSKNESAIIKMICDGLGNAPLADLALEFGWKNPPDDCNAARTRLKKNLRKHGGVFATKHNCAVATELPKAGRK